MPSGARVRKSPGIFHGGKFRGNCKNAGEVDLRLEHSSHGVGVCKALYLMKIPIQWPTTATVTETTRFNPIYVTTIQTYRFDRNEFLLPQVSPCLLQFRDRSTRETAPTFRACQRFPPRLVDPERGA